LACEKAKIGLLILSTILPRENERKLSNLESITRLIKMVEAILNLVSLSEFKNELQKWRTGAE